MFNKFICFYVLKIVKKLMCVKKRSLVNIIVNIIVKITVNVIVNITVNIIV